MCVLCHYTYARSVILMRHFDGCAVRKGNPNGYSHLSQPEAFVKNNAARQNHRGDEGGMNYVGSMFRRLAPRPVMLAGPIGSIGSSGLIGLHVETNAFDNFLG